MRCLMHPAAAVPRHQGLGQLGSSTSSTPSAVASCIGHQAVQLLRSARHPAMLPPASSTVLADHPHPHPSPPPLTPTPHPVPAQAGGSSPPCRQSCRCIPPHCWLTQTAAAGTQVAAREAASSKRHKHHHGKDMLTRQHLTQVGHAASSGQRQGQPFSNSSPTCSATNTTNKPQVAQHM